MRKEGEIFADLQALCKQPGIAHAIAHFCLRDNMVRYSDLMNPDDMTHLFSMEHLVRTEMSSLIGLYVQGPMDRKLPAPDVMQKYLEELKS